MDKFGRILLVEDDPRDVELTLTALEDYNLANEVVIAHDGQEALDYLYGRGKFEGRPTGNRSPLRIIIGRDIAGDRSSDRDVD
jgi:CheY-like chemotaxis protein